MSSTAYWLDPQGRFHRAGRHDTWASDATGIPDGTAAINRLLRAGWARVRRPSPDELEVQARTKDTALRAAREAAAELAAQGEVDWNRVGVVTEWAEPAHHVAVLWPEEDRLVEWNPARWSRRRTQTASGWTVRRHYRPGPRPYWDFEVVDQRGLVLYEAQAGRRGNCTWITFDAPVGGVSEEEAERMGLALRRAIQDTLPPPYLWRPWDSLLCRIAPGLATQRIANPARYQVVRLAPDPRRVLRWRMVRLADGSLLRLAVVPGRGPRGGRTVAVARLVPVPRTRANPPYEVDVQTFPGGREGRIVVYDRVTGTQAAHIGVHPVAPTTRSDLTGTLVPYIESFTNDPQAMLTAFQTLRRTYPAPYLGTSVLNEKVYRMVQALKRRGFPVGIDSVSEELREQGYRPFRNPHYRVEAAEYAPGQTQISVVDPTDDSLAARIGATRRHDTTIVSYIDNYTEDPQAMVTAFQALRRTLPGPYLGSAVANERVYEMVKRLHERGLPVGVSSVAPELMRKGLKPFRNPRRKLSPLMLAALLIPGIPPF